MELPPSPDEIRTAATITAATTATIKIVFRFELEVAAGAAVAASDFATAEGTVAWAECDTETEVSGAGIPALPTVAAV